MTTNPLLNAFAAVLYIVVVASLMFYGPKIVPDVDGVIVPVAFLSLFVLSATIMGHIFFYQPIQLYISDQKTQAVRLFLKTVAIFAVITAPIFASLFFVGTTL